MEPSRIYYNKAEYLETHTGNKVSRRAQAKGSQNIRLNGNCIIFPNVLIRGDLAQVRIGKYTVIKENVVLRPSYKKSKGQLKYVQLSIGDHVYIGEGSIICAQKIGNNVYIGQNCIISHRCVLKDNCRIGDNTILAPDTEIAPFTLFEGVPAQYMSDLPESTPFVMSELTEGFYARFIGRKQ